MITREPPPSNIDNCSMKFFFVVSFSLLGWHWFLSAFLPCTEKSRLRTRDLEWYFFCHRDKKYSNGSRSNRATDGGYWKATGKDKSVIHNSCTVGMRRTLVFHEGKPPKGTRTNWVMYEYRLESRELVDAGFAQVKLASDTYLKVSCMIFVTAFLKCPRGIVFYAYSVFIVLVA